MCLTVGEGCREQVTRSKPEKQKGGTNVQVVDGGVVYRQELQVDWRFPVGDSTQNGTVGTGVTTVNSAVHKSVRLRPSYNKRKRW
jgi:hypothetical protein